MGSVPPLLTFFLALVSGWVHRRQLIVIEFLQAEDRMLKERLRGKRIRFTDAERALLARKANGIEPAPERGKRTRWSTFLKAHWKVFSASDFFSVEVWTPRGLMTYDVLFVISIADRVVRIAGMTPRPDEAWMLQIGRNLLDEAGGVLAGKRYLIIDRDTKYSKRFREFMAEGGTAAIRLPPLSPNLNAFAQRFARSIKGECLRKMVFVGQASLRRAIAEYMAHFHEERNHQGLENRLIRVMPADSANDSTIRRRARLGGMLSYYHRVAA